MYIHIAINNTFRKIINKSFLIIHIFVECGVSKIALFSANKF